MATTEKTATQTVTSSDGTSIAYEKSGAGAPVILVDGALCFREFGPARGLARELASGFTVFCYDRRGRGESDDTPSTLQREIDDIEALIDVAGGTASLYGISSGGALALEAAAALGHKVDKLALYEIPYDGSEDGVRRWREYRKRLAQLLAEERGGDATELFMRFVGASDHGVEGMRNSPVWPVFETVGRTLGNDAAALGDDRVVPVQTASAITATTLVMDGGASIEAMPFMRASADRLAQAIPRAEHRVIEGQGHEVDAAALAPVLREFFAASA